MVALKVNLCCCLLRLWGSGVCVRAHVCVSLRVEEMKVYTKHFFISFLSLQL